jgi:hypothetical protein
VRAVCAVFAVCAGAWCAVACHVVGCTHDHPVQPTHTHRTPATLLPHTHTHTRGHHHDRCSRCSFPSTLRATAPKRSRRTSRSSTPASSGSRAARRL